MEIFTWNCVPVISYRYLRSNENILHSRAKAHLEPLHILIDISEFNGTIGLPFLLHIVSKGLQQFFIQQVLLKVCPDFSTKLVFNFSPYFLIQS